MGASEELSELEEKLADANRRFDRMPGALWLAATAIVESVTRLPLPADLDERRSDLLVRARRARDDAGPRSSENDVSAITAWVELAEKRAVLERAVLAALADVSAHRQAHPELGVAIASRKALEGALSERERDVVERTARLAIAVDPRESAELAKLDASEPTGSDAELLVRSDAARARLAASPMWLSEASFVAAFLGLCAWPLVHSGFARAIVLGIAALGTLAGIVLRVRVRRARRTDLVEAHAMRRRDEAREADAREDQARLVLAARALGALDAFGATDDGRTLEDRESKLVALAPWIRELVSGFDKDEAARFS